MSTRAAPWHLPTTLTFMVLCRTKGPAELLMFPPKATENWDAVEKLFPSSSQDYYFSIPFSPATIAHSTKPLPILALFRSK